MGAALNLYTLELGIQSALRTASREPLLDAMGVSPYEIETLQAMGLVDTDGKLTSQGQTLLDTSKPEVGMGVTQSCGSDAYAWTIVEVLSPKRVIVQSDRSVRRDRNGLSESQSYVHVVGANEERRTLTLRSDGRWREAGKQKVRGHYFSIGERNAYRDPSR